MTRSPDIVRLALVCLTTALSACAGRSQEGGPTIDDNDARISGAAHAAVSVDTAVGGSGAAPPAGAPEESDGEREFRELLASMGVRLDRAARTLRVDGWVNMQKGLVEVFACAPDGKTHEAVVVIDCVPSGLHAGLLALGLEPGTPVELGTDAEYKPPTGALIDIRVRWRDAAGRERIAHAEDWVWNQLEERAMHRAPWIFAGSFLQESPGVPGERTYAANYVKSVVTTYHDASSVIENPSVAGADDTVYYAHEAVLPPAGTPVRVEFAPAGVGSAAE